MKKHNWKKEALQSRWALCQVYDALKSSPCNVLPAKRILADYISTLSEIPTEKIITISFPLTVLYIKKP